MPNEKSIFNINGTDFPLSDPNAVKFDRQQSLTSQQKAQAIANMGISDVFKGLLYRGEWLGHSLNYSEGNGFWFVPANTLTASADLPGEYQTTKEAVYAVIDLEPSDLTTSPLKRIKYLAWLESYMSGHVVLKVYRRPEVSISGGGGVSVYEWENASAPVDTMKSIAIIVSGDRASMAVPVGGYAYIKDNTHGLAEGLYTNTSSAAFPTVGGIADDTVFTAVSGGLGAEVTSLNSKLTNYYKYVDSESIYYNQITWVTRDAWKYAIIPFQTVFGRTDIIDVVNIYWSATFTIPAIDDQSLILMMLSRDSANSGSCKVRGFYKS